MTGRLIDADALYTLFVKMKSFGELTAKKAIRCVEEAPTVEAIPIEWIKKWMDRKDSWNREGVITLIRDWNEGKKNE